MDEDSQAASTRRLRRLFQTLAFTASALISAYLWVSGHSNNFGLVLTFLFALGSVLSFTLFLRSTPPT